MYGHCQDNRQFTNEDVCETAGVNASFYGVTKTNVGLNCDDSSSSTTTNVYGETMNVDASTANTVIGTADTKITSATTLIGTNTITISGNTVENTSGTTTIDRKGNVTVPKEMIEEQVQHNVQELNRKLDSYLGSIAAVNEETGGQLTKDQEDNLAYLHNLGKESNVRMQKIMADVRKQLPKTFLLKTSKTPEQLSKENASSDLNKWNRSPG